MKFRTLLLLAALLLGAAACSASPTAAGSAGQLGSGAAHSTSPCFGSGAGIEGPPSQPAAAFGSGAGLAEEDTVAADGPFMGSGG